jgi:hypothetical protein
MLTIILIMLVRILCFLLADVLRTGTLQEFSPMAGMDLKVGVIRKARPFGTYRSDFTFLSHRPEIGWNQVFNKETEVPKSGPEYLSYKQLVHLHLSGSDGDRTC